jgi:hypothetical protein
VSNCGIWPTVVLILWVKVSSSACASLGKISKLMDVDAMKASREASHGYYYLSLLAKSLDKLGSTNDSAISAINRTDSVDILLSSLDFCGATAFLFHYWLGVILKKQSRWSSWWNKWSTGSYNSASDSWSSVSCRKRTTISS